MTYLVLFTPACPDLSFPFHPFNPLADSFPVEPNQLEIFSSLLPEYGTEGASLRAKRSKSKCECDECSKPARYNQR